jgi:hypothetical protein
MPDNLVKILRLNFRIPAFVGIQHDVWALLTGAEAHIGFDFDVGEPFGGNFCFQFSRQLFRAAGFTIDILAN